MDPIQGTPQPLNQPLTPINQQLTPQEAGQAYARYYVYQMAMQMVKQLEQQAHLFKQQSN